VRPYAVQFLREMSELYEVMIFTASHACYANVVLNILDPRNEYITYRLFRDQCLQTNEGIFIKDLRIIANRAIDHMLIVDNATYSFAFQLENGIPIVPFYSCSKDTELLDLMHYLRLLAPLPELRALNSHYFMYDLITQHCADPDYDALIQRVLAQDIDLKQMIVKSQALN
jgi:CTD small phosphatase-like protein 2